MEAKQDPTPFIPEEELTKMVNAVSHLNVADAIGLANACLSFVVHRTEGLHQSDPKVRKYLHACRTFVESIERIQSE